MERRAWYPGVLGVVVLLLLSACAAGPATPALAPAPAEPVTPERGAAMLFVLSNSSPHVSVIDTTTNQVVRTADIPGFTSWTWNDDNNYFDGTNLWLGMRDPETDDVEVIALNLDTLEVTHRIPLGKDQLNLYIGKATSQGTLLVGKMKSGQVVAIDTKTAEVLATWDEPVNGDVVCDADVAVGPDGIERFYYPTRKGDTVVSIDPRTGEVLKIVETPQGSTPLMLTTAPDNTVWVQEVSSNTNAVLDPVTLEVKGRFLTGMKPVVASFSPDGKYGYIGHLQDTVVVVVDTATLEEVQRVQVGSYPEKLAIHPSGRYVYAILTKEAAVAVIDTESWQVTQRIPLDANPTGIYLRPGA